MALRCIGMNVGNIVDSNLVDRSLIGTIDSMLVFNIVVMTLFGLTAAHLVMRCLGVSSGPAGACTIAPLIHRQY